MKVLIVYDSLFGNTEKISRSIAKGFSEVLVKHVNDADVASLKQYDLIIVGSPVNGGRPTPDTEVFLRNIPKNELKEKKVTAFDTRFAPEQHAIGIRILLFVIRYAAERIAKQLVNKGGKLIKRPEGFIVLDKKGPLMKGELERAKDWGISLENEGR